MARKNCLTGGRYDITRRESIILTIILRIKLKRYLTELPRREGTMKPEVVTLLNRLFQSLLRVC